MELDFELKKTLQRIVDLRQSGLTWWQVDEILYPVGLAQRKIANRSIVYHLAYKYRDGIAGGAFEKRVIGAWSPTQIVERLRPHVTEMTASPA